MARASEKQTLAEAVLAALPAAARPRSDAELAHLVRTFLAGGRAAVRAHAGTVAQAAKAAADGRRITGEARRRVARLTRPTRRIVTSPPVWAGVLRVLKHHREGLLKYPGVAGIGPGFRWRNGVATGERCIHVYVRSKQIDPAEPLPRVLSAGRLEIPVDVVEFGELRRLTRGGASLGMQGSALWGTVGVCAQEAGGAFVALTAMHVTGLRQNYPPGPPIIATSPRNGATLGHLLQGFPDDIDAAKISLEPPNVGSFQVDGIGGVNGWRPLDLEADVGTSVRMFGAASGLVAGQVERPSLDLPGDRLVGAILVRIVSQAGDSGAALLDNQNLVLGLLVGEASSMSDMRVFSPIGPVLHRLGCDIPSA
jgi:hypothetical protein